MALILTYARAHSHDRPYFNDPLKLLSGEIAPPSFNLRNDVMVRKHAHAIVLTGLHKLSRPNSELTNTEQIELVEVLRRCFPNRVREYLFENTGEVRRRLPDLAPLRTEYLGQHTLDRLHTGVVEAFRQGWPDDDARVVEPATLRGYIEDMDGQLQSVSRDAPVEAPFGVGPLTR